MSDPCGTLISMETQGVTATDLRVHFKDLANQIADGGAPAVISRHGFKMVALISYEDFLLLQEIKRKQRSGKAEQSPVVSGHPEELPSIEEVERLYKATQGATDERTVHWRYLASILLRRANSPLASVPWWSSPPTKDPPS